MFNTVSTHTITPSINFDSIFVSHMRVYLLPGSRQRDDLLRAMSSFQQSASQTDFSQRFRDAESTAATAVATVRRGVAESTSQQYSRSPPQQQQQQQQERQQPSRGNARPTYRNGNGNNNSKVNGKYDI